MHTVCDDVTRFVKCIITCMLYGLYHYPVLINPYVLYVTVSASVVEPYIYDYITASNMIIHTYYVCGISPRPDIDYPCMPCMWLYHHPVLIIRPYCMYVNRRVQIASCRTYVLCFLSYRAVQVLIGRTCYVTMSASDQDRLSMHVLYMG
jgi:hypothetical protein